MTVDEPGSLLRMRKHESESSYVGKDLFQGENERDKFVCLCSASKKRQQYYCQYQRFVVVVVENMRME